MAFMTRMDITLGILAGGRASRLGGIDKAWIMRGGVAQVVRWQHRFAAETAAILVSANRDLPRYAQAGLTAVADRIEGEVGPLAGLEALLAHCPTPWLFTLPVDLVGVNDCLLPSLIAGGGEHGAYAVDDDGPQPLVALWKVSTAREAIADALAAGDIAVHSLHRRMGTAVVRLPGVRFGNLNTPEDLRDADARSEDDH